MSKKALGTRPSAFGRTGVAVEIGFRKASDAYSNVLSSARGQREAAMAEIRKPSADRPFLAECRMLSADCCFSPHIARSCTVTLRDTSVTNMGLADSVLIGVGKLLFGRGSGGGCRLDVTSETRVIAPLEEALASNGGD
jgi:hypothetical protein